MASRVLELQLEPEEVEANEEVFIFFISCAIAELLEGLPSGESKPENKLAVSHNINQIKKLITRLTFIRFYFTVKNQNSRNYLSGRHDFSATSHTS